MSKKKEKRLWDSQWANIVNHSNCLDGYTKEEAIAEAVKMTEQAMAENIKDNNWPNARA